MDTRNRAPRSSHRPVLQFRLAHEQSERLAAYRLVYSAYVSSGLMSPNSHALRITPYHLLPTTATFVALQGGKVVSTLSLIADGPDGFPIESAYPAQIAERRQQGLHLGEVSCLASADLPPELSSLAFGGLTRLMAQFARRQQMHQLLIAVHPRHARFYQRCLGFHLFGPQIHYPTVQNRLAVGCCLDFAHIDTHRPACYDHYFAQPIPDQELRPRPMSGADQVFFRQLLQATSAQSIAAA